MKNLFLLLLTVATSFGAVGSWNGVAFTQWNGVAQTGWNGTSISCAGGGGGGTPAFVEFVNTTASASASTRTINITVASGATIVVGTKWEDNARTPSVSSDLDGAFTAGTQVNQGGQVYGQMFRKIGCTAGAHTITINYGSATPFVHGGAWELSGVTALDEEATGNTGTDDTAQTGSITADNNVVVLLSMSANYVGANMTPEASPNVWTEDYDAAEIAFQRFTTSAIGSYSASCTLSGNGAHVLLMAGFK